MKLFTSADFKEMPWKNGGGTTIELRRFENGEDFFLRLSQASVTKDGPFSQYPFIDRILLILKGHGCELTLNQSHLSLTKDSAPFVFRGEDQIECKLQNGAVTDFNVMVDRRWGKANAERLNTEQKLVVQCESDFCFLFQAEEMRLIELEKSEFIELPPGQKWIKVTVNRIT